MKNFSGRGETQVRMSLRRRIPSSMSVSRIQLDHLSRRRKPENVADQLDLIRKVTSNPDCPDCPFYYMVYAVDPSSEFYTPYCLKYAYKAFFILSRESAAINYQYTPIPVEPPTIVWRLEVETQM